MTRRETVHNESGAAFIEAIFSLPILIVFTFAMLDLGNWFNQHYALTRIVYEAARTGSGLGDLKEVASTDVGAAFDGTEMPCIREDLNSAMTASLTFNEQGHYIMKSRMNALAAQQLTSSNHVLINQAIVWSCYDESERVVQAEISVPFQSMIGRLFNINGWLYRTNMWPNVTAKARAPYLFAN